MKIKILSTKKSRAAISECKSFWSWLYFDNNYPWMPAGEEHWFRYMGSAHRVFYRRFFGFETEIEYVELAND